MVLEVDKELIFEFLLIDDDEAGDVHLVELRKVISIVLNKYHPKNYAEYPELEAQILLKIYENKKNYSPEYDAYNYVFTIARNESGNQLKRLSKEILSEEFWSLADEAAGEAFDDVDSLELKSPILQKYYSKFLGIDSDWDYVRIRQDELPELLLFLHRYKSKEIPLYLKIPGISERLYYILTKLLLDE